jgi:cytochrome c oxidase subunit 1
MLIVPAGLEYFALLATMIGGSIALRTPMLFALGFMAQFLIGGLSGIFVASPPLDYHAHDTFLVVAHFHYTLFAGSVFALFAAVYYWFPKVTGALLREGLGKLHFVVMVIGTNLTFGPMFFLGYDGMPRRIADYTSADGWTGLNSLATAGAFLIALSIAIFIANVVVSLRRRESAGDDPWEGQTLEWATASPPPSYNFAYLPTVDDLDPLWSPTERPVVTGLRTDLREILVTDAIDATPDHRQHLDGASIWPFLTAMAAGIGVITAIFTPWGVTLGAVLCIVTLTGWFWPRASTAGEARQSA